MSAAVVFGRPAVPAGAGPPVSRTSTPPSSPTSAAATSATARLPVTVQMSGTPPWSTEPDIGVRRTATDDLPSAEVTAVLLARGLVEVLAGRRSPSQLAQHCAPHVSAGLQLQIPPVANPLPRLLSVRVCEPADGTAEVCVVFRRAEHVRAMAFRLEGIDGRCRITVLQLG